jgi:DNA-binding XRE family transcriptional regulator
MSEQVYNRIAMLRVERKISRRQLAEALGVHYQTIGYLERGEFSPSLHLALRIADFFEVPLEVVFALRPFPRLGDPDDGSPPARTALRRGQAHQSEETTG